jgi:hypothetical protein
MNLNSRPLTANRPKNRPPPDHVYNRCVLNAHQDAESAGVEAEHINVSHVTRICALQARAPKTPILTPIVYSKTVSITERAATPVKRSAKGDSPPIRDVEPRAMGVSSPPESKSNRNPIPNTMTDYSKIGRNWSSFLSRATNTFIFYLLKATSTTP